MEKTTLQVLTEARRHITPKQNWFGAQDNSHNYSGRCALQAVDFVCLRAGADEVRLAARAAMNAAVGGNMFMFNDRHTHAEVLSAVDRAIAAERAKESGSHLSDQVQSIIDDALTVATRVADPVA